MCEKYRCSVCDSVNDPEIENLPGNYKTGNSYHEDKWAPHLMVCSSCLDSIQDTEEDEDLLTEEII